MKALVTGASSGIGLALSRRLARRGVEVWLAARRVDRLERAAAEICAGGGRAHAFPLDVCHAEGAAARIAGLDDAVGGLDLVVAAAGRDEPTPGELVTWGQVRRLFDLNVVGAAATLLPLVPRMRGRGRGHLVAISSLAAQCPLPGGAPYGASKAALSYLLEALADDLAPLGIAVTLVEPGFVETPMTARHPFPMPFAVSADRAAAVIDRAIRRRVRRVRFPWPLVLLVRLGGLVPARLRAAILRWAVPRACGTAGVEGLSP